MPTRYLKPGICDSERMEKCKDEPLAETLFYRLLVNVDDYGRFDARLSMIKSRCFPLRDEMPLAEIDRLLRILSCANLIQVYTTASGEKFLQLSKWDNVPRSKESKFPVFNETCIQEYTDAQQMHTNLPVTVTVTETDNRKQKQETQKNIVVLPDWLPQNKLDEFKLHRKSIKKPMSERAVDLLVGELIKLHDAGHDAISCLDEAILQGWMKPYPPKNKLQENTPAGKFDPIRYVNDKEYAYKWDAQKGEANGRIIDLN